MSVRTALRAKRLGLGRGVLGDGLGALGDGVLGQLSGEDEADGGLDLAGREGGLAVVAGQAAGLGSGALEHVVDEGVQDGHGALGDAGVGVHLLQDLVQVRGVGLSALGLALGALGGALAGLAGLSLSLSRFSRHDEVACWVSNE